jgi:hypothetical protein
VPTATTERIRRIRLALRRAHVDLLHAHALTVAALGRIELDRERRRDALLEARRQHEALYLVRKAVDALITPSGPAASSPEPPASRKSGAPGPARVVETGLDTTTR